MSDDRYKELMKSNSCSIFIDSIYVSRVLSRYFSKYYKKQFFQGSLLERTIIEISPNIESKNLPIFMELFKGYLRHYEKNRVEDLALYLRTASNAYSNINLNTQNLYLAEGLGELSIEIGNLGTSFNDFIDKDQSEDLLEEKLKQNLFSINSKTNSQTKH